MAIQDQEKLSPRLVAVRAELTRGSGSGLLMIFLVLGVLGLGGGLTLALLGYSSSEPLARVGPVQPEVIYARPVLQALPVETLSQVAAAAPVEVQENTLASAFESAAAELPEPTFADASITLANLDGHSVPLGDLFATGTQEPATTNYVAANFKGISPATMNDLPAANLTEQGYAGLETAAVPEPSTWALLGVGGLLALRAMKKSRRSAG